MRILVEGFQVDYPYFWLEVGEPPKEVDNLPFEWARKEWAVSQAQLQGYKPDLPIRVESEEGL